eukprot:776651-Rhodomonas_salina.4
MRCVGGESSIRLRTQKLRRTLSNSFSDSHGFWLCWNTTWPKKYLTRPRRQQQNSRAVGARAKGRINWECL